MLARARTFAIVGVEALVVDAEVDIHRGLPAFSVVGLPDAAVRESRERVRAAIVNCGYEFPLKRITVSLAPSDLRKAGAAFDLAIAAAILVASGQLPAALLSDWAFAGELALDGRLREVRGALAMADAARAIGSGGLALPRGNGAEAAMIEGLGVAPLDSLAALGGLARGELPEAPAAGDGAGTSGRGATALGDLADLRGQPTLRRGLEIAAAGGHSLLVVGPRGRASHSAPGGYRRSCRRCRRLRRSRSQGSPGWLACRPPARDPFAPRITRSRPRAWSVGGRRRDPVRSASPIAASSSSTSSPSSPEPRSRPCVSRSSRAR